MHWADHRCRVAALAVAFAAGLIGCAKQEEEPMLCYVGGTMRPAMEELIALYKKETGQDIEISYADSGALLITIQHSRHGDLYVCHDPFGAALERRELGRRIWTVAALTPTIAVPKGNPKNIRGLRDLAGPGIRLGLTDPEYSTLGHICPVMFEKADIAGEIENNIATRSRMGGQVANAVGIGNLDAAIVWNAVIFARRDKLQAVDIEAKYRPHPEVDAVTSPTFGHIDMSCIKVTIATLGCSKRPEAATAFAEFVASERGKAVFAAHGFSPSPGDQPAKAGKDTAPATDRNVKAKP